MKKVLHVITGLNDGGAEGVLARLCLNSQQVQHVVVSLMDGGKYGPVLKSADIEVHYLNMRPARPSISKLLKLRRIIRNERPDVVQTWMYHADLLGGIAAKAAGVKRIFWGIRHSTLEKGKSKRSTILIARLCAILSHWLPEKIICCAQKARTVHAEIGYSKKKLEVIPNGFDLSRFKPDSALREQLRNELNIGPDEFLIGMVARFDPQKDHENLLEALTIVAQKVSFRCILVGRGLSPDNTQLVQKLSELGLTDQVELLGPRKDMPAIMNALDLHVLSSAYGEAFPNVLAEAMACGTPCVTTDVGDAREIIGETGLWCESRDSEGLANSVVELALESKQEPVDWQNRHNASVKRVLQQFSIDRMLNSFESLWLRT